MTLFNLAVTCVGLLLIEFVVVFLLVRRNWDILRNYNKQGEFGVGLKHLKEIRPNEAVKIYWSISITLATWPLFVLVKLVFY